jgi:hypothetical protein
VDFCILNVIQISMRISIKDNLAYYDTSGNLASGSGGGANKKGTAVNSANSSKNSIKSASAASSKATSRNTSPDSSRGSSRSNDSEIESSDSEDDDPELKGIRRTEQEIVRQMKGAREPIENGDPWDIVESFKRRIPWIDESRRLDCKTPAWYVKYGLDDDSQISTYFTA